MPFPLSNGEKWGILSHGDMLSLSLCFSFDDFFEYVDSEEEYLSILTWAGLINLC